MSSRQVQPCGTVAAYQRHRAHGEEACDACHDAKAVKGRRERGGSGPSWLRTADTPPPGSRRAQLAAQAAAVASAKAGQADALHREIGRLAAAGHSTPYIARELGLTSHTVLAHLRRIRRAAELGRPSVIVPVDLDDPDRLAAARLMTRRPIVELEDCREVLLAIGLVEAADA